MIVSRYSKKFYKTHSTYSVSSDDDDERSLAASQLLCIRQPLGFSGVVVQNSESYPGEA